MEGWRTGRQTRLIGLHVSAKDHGDLPGHGLRQAGRCRGQGVPSKYYLVGVRWDLRDRHNGDRTEWDSEAWGWRGERTEGTVMGWW